MTRGPKRRTAGRKPSKRKTAAKVQAKPDDLNVFIATGAQWLDIAIDPAWLPAVRTHLEVTLRHGAVVTAFALPDETDPAPVFKT